jgi:hypothetical protein
VRGKAVGYQLSALGWRERENGRAVEQKSGRTVAWRGPRPSPTAADPCCACVPGRCPLRACHPEHAGQDSENRRAKEQEEQALTPALSQWASENRRAEDWRCLRDRTGRLIIRLSISPPFTNGSRVPDIRSLSRESGMTTSIPPAPQVIVFDLAFGRMRPESRRR